MGAEKIKVCLVLLSDAPDVLENLKRIILSCADPPLIISQVFPAVSNRVEIQEAVKAIGRLKPEMVFIVLTSSHLKQTVLFVNSLQEDGLKLDTLAFLEDSAADATIDLLKLGIADVISPPFTEENVVPRIWRILNCTRDPGEKLLSNLKEKLGLQKLIGRNAAFLVEVNKIPLIARCDANVLIAGETGTGKDIYARSIHYLGRRARKAVRCGELRGDSDRLV